VRLGESEVRVRLVMSGTRWLAAVHQTVERMSSTGVSGSCQAKSGQSHPGMSSHDRAVTGPGDPAFADVGDEGGLADRLRHSFIDLPGRRVPRIRRRVWNMRIAEIFRFGKKDDDDDRRHGGWGHGWGHGWGWGHGGWGWGHGGWGWGHGSWGRWGS
jgi:hypothetical protein